LWTLFSSGGLEEYRHRLGLPVIEINSDEVDAESYLKTMPSIVF
jgi:hypothetical protein